MRAVLPAAVSLMLNLKNFNNSIIRFKDGFTAILLSFIKPETKET